MPKKDGVDRAAEIRRGKRFEREALTTGVNFRVILDRAGDASDEQDGRLGAVSSDAGRAFEAVDFRHEEIDNGQVSPGGF